MFLWRAAGKPEPESSKQTFKDVPTSHPFYKEIQWAYENGITTGYSGKPGYFGLYDGCTRGQIMMFLWRFEGMPEPANTTTPYFTDVGVSHGFFKAVQWASENHITNGYSDGTFGVNRNCTRGHCIQFLYKVAA